MLWNCCKYSSGFFDNKFLCAVDHTKMVRYDFEQNKRNNLIFYGVPGEERESRDDLR